MVGYLLTTLLQIYCRAHITGATAAVRKRILKIG